MKLTYALKKIIMRFILWIFLVTIGGKEFFCGFWQERRVSRANPARPCEQSGGVNIFIK